MHLKEELEKRILILDGAMGTMIQRKVTGNNEALNLSRPEIILDIHRQYIAAGADIIETNSFGANRISQAEYGGQEQAAQMAFQSAVLARRAADEADHRILVAGSIGPTGKSLSLCPDLGNPSHRDVDFDTLAQAYREQIEALAKGGADILLLETCFDALNAKAALLAASEVAPQLPVMVSVSVGDRSGRTLTGQTIEAFYRSVEHGNLISFGLNCSLGAADMAPMVADVATFSHHYVSCHPNAGLPDEMGRYTQTPEQMASEMATMAAKGYLNIAGGCCGTTPEHIAAIAEAMRGKAPHRLNAGPDCLTVSGLEAVSVDRKRNNFTNVGERTNVAGSRKFAKLIAAGDYESALQVAADQIEGGASIIDINMDDAMLDSTVQMRTFLRYISNDPAVAKAALMIDSSRWETVLEGLKNAQGKCIVNSISLKEGKDAFLHKALTIKSLGGAMVVMAFDEEGQATDYARKISICGRAYRLLTNAGIKPTDIIFDVNVLSVGTGIAEHAKFGVDFIEAVRWIKGNLKGALTSGGISNLSFAFRGNNPVREAMHSVFLYHAGNAGLDMGIVNPGMLKVYDDIEPDLLERVEDVILDRRPDATQRLLEKAQNMQETATAAKEQDAAPATDDGPVDARLTAALVKGSSPRLREDILESLEQHGGKPVDVIEGPLMEGMARVGELFGAGKMFLPQVVKSAKVMRDAVQVLQPYMDASDESGSSRPRVVIATVKGDVHDIGKNITATVLRCNGFDVTDLGVMVPLEDILRATDTQKADLIAISGLITPSLFQMEELCREMAARGMTTPLLVGGATTSAVHTAVKLAPLYGHVFHGSDASSSAVMAKRLMASRSEFEAQEHTRQAELRKLHESGQAIASSHCEKPEQFPEDSFLKAGTLKDIPASEISMAQVVPFFDWKIFNAVWGMKGENPELHADAQRLLDSGDFRIMLALHFEDCGRDGNDIQLKSGRRLPMLRQETGKRQSLADFVAIANEKGGSELPGQAGFLAISVADRRYKNVSGKHAPGCTCPQCAGTDYDSMLKHSVKVTLAEAASSWVDSFLQQQLKAAGREDMKVVKPAAGYASCPDHSLKKDIMEIIPESDRLGIKFTESFAMIPEASICAMVFAHPNACYPEIRKLSAETIAGYSRKRGFSPSMEKQLLGHLR